MHPPSTIVPAPAPRLVTFLTALALATLAGCGGGGGGASKPSALSVALTPTDGLLLNVDRGGGLHGEPIQLHFGGSMQPGTVRVTGTATIAEQDLGWSGVDAPDDTLEVFPSAGAAWPAGPGRTIHVEGTSASGAAVFADFTVLVADLAPAITLSPSPPALTTIEPVVVQFNFPADEGRLTLAGGVVGAAYTLGWAADHTSVTLTPTTAWTAGPGQFLVVTVRGAHSDAVFASRSVSYDVSAAPTARGPGGSATAE